MNRILTNESDLPPKLRKIKEVYDDLPSESLTTPFAVHKRTNIRLQAVQEYLKLLSQINVVKETQCDSKTLYKKKISGGEI